MGIIYILTNRVNGKKYVGQTKGKLHQRLYAHRHSKYPIGKAIAEYGWLNFRIERFEYPDDRLEYMERKYVKDFHSLFPDGYNLTSGGDGVKGITAVTKEKMRLAKLGKRRGPMSEETKRKISMAPHRMPAGFGEKIRKALTGKHLSEEHRRNIGIALKGKRHSPEWSRKIGDAQLGEKNHAFGKKPWNYRHREGEAS